MNSVHDLQCHQSNTYSLLAGNGNEHAKDGGEGTQWSGVLIEANPQKFRELKKLYDPLVGNICVCAEVSYKPTSSRSLMSILKRDAPHLPPDFDFLSIDIDGMDYWVLADTLGVSIPMSEIMEGEMSNSYRPKVICIEFNPTMPIDLVYVQPRDDNIRHGSSLSALVELANAANYTLVETTLFNAFFVQKEIYDMHLVKEVPDTSIEALHEVSMGTELYQLYDGTTHLWGCKRLWHRLPIDEEKIQMLPPEKRSFPFHPSVAVSSSISSEVRMKQKQSGGSNTSEISDRRMKQQQTKCQNTSDEKSKSDRLREMAVDMSPYCDTHATMDRKRECFAKLNKSLHRDGFALVRGFGIPESLCKDALRAAKSFLHEADESVRRSCLTKDRARRGYSPMCSENFASLIGKHGPNDLVKKFRIGPQPNKKDLDTLHPMSSLHQPNEWPSAEVWGDENASHFKFTIEEYFARSCHAADCILRAICDGMIDEKNNLSIVESIKVLSPDSCNSENDADTVDESKNHTSILTLLGYQPGSRHKKGSKGYMRPLVSAHTDVGMITLLHFDGGKCAALERAYKSSNIDPETIEWIDVDLPPFHYDDPLFVVNVGDCLSDLSGGSLRSTLHRVMPRPCPPNDAALDDIARTCLAFAPMPAQTSSA
jgi:isopenicillin N synthase-like dioxygenase